MSEKEAQNQVKGKEAEAMIVRDYHLLSFGKDFLIMKDLRLSLEFFTPLVLNRYLSLVTSLAARP